MGGLPSVVHRMPKATRFLSCSFALLLALGCRRLSERTLRDTEGRVFTATCDRDQRCKIVQTSGAKRSDGKTEVALSASSRLIGLCDVVPEGEPESPAECRALICKDDDDCPPAHGMRDGQCLEGYCSDAAKELAPADAVMLCLAGTGLGREQPRQVERYALALNCGSPCRLPAPCRK
jgi:hypothetical protein